MYNKTRRIKLRLKADSVLDILNLLEIDQNEEVVVQLSLPDNKSTYQTLSSDSSKILDWDFLNETENKEDDYEEGDHSEGVDVVEVGEKKFKTLTSSEQPIEEQGLIDKDVISFFELCSIVSTQDLVLFIEAVWRVATERPNIRISTNLFESTVLLEMKELRESSSNIGFHLTTDRALTKLLLEVYYNISSVVPSLAELEIAFFDTLEKIKNNYSLIKEADTINKVSNILYRYEQYNKDKDC